LELLLKEGKEKDEEGGRKKTNTVIINTLPNLTLYEFPKRLIQPT